MFHDEAFVKQLPFPLTVLKFHDEPGYKRPIDRQHHIGLWFHKLFLSDYARQFRLSI